MAAPHRNITASGRRQEGLQRSGGGSGGSTKWSSKVCPERTTRYGWVEEEMANANSPGGSGYFLAGTTVNSAEPVSREVPREQSQVDEGRSVAATGSPSPAGTQQHFLPTPRSGGQPQQHQDVSPPPRIPESVDAMANGARRSARATAPAATSATEEKLFPVSRVWKSTALAPDLNFPKTAPDNAGESN